MSHPADPSLQLVVVLAVEVKTSFLKEKAEAILIVEHLIPVFIEIRTDPAIDYASDIFQRIDLAIGLYLLRVLPPFYEAIRYFHKLKLAAFAIEVSLIQKTATLADSDHLYNAKCTFKTFLYAS